jgi:TrmH family RNA methyltransferase
MITKAELKYFSSLLVKKYRDEYGRFLVEGTKFVLEALNSNWSCEIIILTKDYSESEPKQFQYISEKVNRVEIVTPKDFTKVQTTINSQGIVGVFHKKIISSKSEFKSNLIVALENINDPGNCGTIIRIADWFGINEILLSETCADLYNPKTIRASAGSMFHVKIFNEVNFLNKILELKKNGYRVLCADLTGKSIYNYESNPQQVIVFSNEASGPSNELLQIAYERITIPKKGKAESLNVASASAIVLSELIKE